MHPEPRCCADALEVSRPTSVKGAQAVLFVRPCVTYELADHGLSSHLRRAQESSRRRTYVQQKVSLPMP